MPRVTPRLLQYGLLCALVWTVGCPSTLSPQLSVAPVAFNFLPPAQAGPETDVFNITNSGGGTVNWSITSTPTWLTASPLNGSVGHSGLQPVTMTIDRTGLSAGIHNGHITVTSNAGDQDVAVSVTVVGPPTPVLSVNPGALDFGSADTDHSFTIKNTGTGTLNWTLASDQSWLTLSVLSGDTTSETDSIKATVDRTGLSAGTHTANITVSSNGGSATVTATLSVPGPAPVLLAAPTTLDFGTQTTTKTFTITNTGTGTLKWTLTENLPWLSLSSTKGDTTTTPAAITVTVDRTGLPAGPLSGAIALTSDGGNTTINVTATVAATQLVVSPTTLNFGSFTTSKLFTVSNGGIGTVNWNIDTTAFPAWLSLSPSSGSVTTTSQGVVVSVDRTGLAPNNYSQTFTVTSNAGTATVTVNMTVAVTPVLTVESGQISVDGRPLVPVGDKDLTRTFTIRNTGTGSLDWTMDPTTFPAWLTIAPVAGSQTNGQTKTITVTVDRTNLAVGPYKQDVVVKSNGGTVTVEVSMVVPLRAEIGVDVDHLDFGLTSSVGSFSVANYGDPGTILNFIVNSDKVWLFNSPSTGNSVGVSTPPPFKDYRSINIAVDRGNLESVGSTGTFTIQAVDGAGVIMPEIAPKTVLISVEASPLSFEQANARTRIPSLVQFAFIMRDFRNQAISATPADLANSFQIVEAGVPLEATETNQFITSGDKLRTNLTIMLDFSGSLFDSVQGSTPPGTDKLLAAYIDAVGAFITNLPANYRISLMEFHDRSQATRLVQDFTEDRVALIAKLNAIAIQDHGASPLLPAVDDATGRLRDTDAQLLSFDNADVRATVVISDGRLTTPPGLIQDSIDLAVNNRVRVFAVGWGEQINNEPLARLAVGTGGHYYPTRGDTNGKPTLAELKEKLGTIITDLKAQMVLTYVTLNESEKVSTRVNAQVDNPNDTPDQGILQGTFQQDLSLAAISGDVKMGQISMRSSGVSGAGEATVTLRLDYAPRNVSHIRFTLSGAQAFGAPVLVTLDNGGIVSDWDLKPLGGNAFDLTPKTPGQTLQYGAFGNLVTIPFVSVGGATPFAMGLTIDNTIYTGADQKYFIYPDTITVNTAPSIAPAFPTALVTPSVIDFGTGTNTQNLAIQNIGGSYPYGFSPTLVDLEWKFDTIPSFVTVNPLQGSRSTTVGSDTATVTADRTISPGNYSGTLILTYTGNTLGIANAVQIPIKMQVTAAILAVSKNTLNFGGAPTTSLSFNVTNAGQSTLDWQFSTAGFPAWLTAFPASGTTTNEQDPVTVMVDRTGLAAGAYTYSFPVTSTNGGAQTITVNMSVP